MVLVAGSAAEKVGARGATPVCTGRFFGCRAISCGGAALVAVALSLVAAFAFGPLTPGRSDGAVAMHPRAIARHAAGTKLPLAAQGPVSRILGRDDPSYRALRAGNGGLALRNRGQHLSTWFDWRGVLIRSGRVSLRLSLTGYGYGAVLHAVGAVRPRAQANRVVYRREASASGMRTGRSGSSRGSRFEPARRGACWTVDARARAVGQRAHALSPGLTRSRSRAAVSLAYRGLVATDARRAACLARAARVGVAAAHRRPRRRLPGADRPVHPAGQADRLRRRRDDCSALGGGVRRHGRGRRARAPR